jgi:hypothetical protein
MLSLGAVSYPSGLGFGCKAGRWEFESQLDPLLLMLCEEIELPWWLKVSLLPEISKQTKQQTKRRENKKGKTNARYLYLNCRVNFCTTDISA